MPGVKMILIIVNIAAANPLKLLGFCTAKRPIRAFARQKQGAIGAKRRYVPLTTAMVV
jgi:hypothetical protein